MPALTQGARDRFGPILAIFGNICMWALPMLALFLALGDAERRDSLRALEAAKDDLVRVAAHYRRLSDPADRVGKFLGRIVRGLSRGTDCRQLAARLGRDHLEILAFNTSGKRLRLPGFSRELQSLSERVLAVIRAYHRDPGFSPSRNESKLVEAFFDDPGIAEILAQTPGKVLDLSRLGSRKLAGWYQLDPNPSEIGFLLVRIDGEKIPLVRVAETAKKSMSRLAPKQYRFGWFSLADPLVQSGLAEVSERAVPISTIRAELAKDRLEPCFRLGNRLFATVTLENGIQLCVSSALPEVSQSYRNWGHALAGSALLLLGFTLWTTFGGIRPTIRLRLIFLFGIAAASGFLLLWISAMSYLETRQENLLRENRDQAFRLLQKIDTDFQNFLETSTRPYHNFLDEWERRLAVNASASAPPWNQRLDVDLLSAFVADREGEFQHLFNSPASKGLFSIWDMSGRKGMSLVVKLAIARINGISSARESALIAASPVKLDHFMNQTIKELAKTDRKMVRYVFQSQVSDRFSGFVRLPDGKAVGAVTVKFDTTLLERRFLYRMARRVQRVKTSDGKSLRLLAVPKPVWSRLFPIPRTIGFYEDLENVLDQINQKGIFAVRLGSYRGASSQISGIPGNFLLHYNLCMVFPFSPIQAELSGLFNRFMTIGILSIFFAFFLAHLIAAGLVQPLSELTRGIVRLTRSQYHAPVTVRTGDELEVLGRGIGTIMEEMAELQVAQAIQDQLFPDRRLDGAGWAIKGWTRSPFEIGGDVYDYLAVPSGAVGFYVARIIGRSISSALEMAMTKMAMRVLFDLDILDPERIIEAFQSHFGHNLPFLRKLEICIGVFDSSRGLLRIAAVGDVQMAVFPGDESMPVREPPWLTGTGEIAGLRTASLELLPGTRVLLHSASLTHVSEGVATCLAGEKRVPIDHLGPAVFAVLDKVAGPGEQAASQTFVLLELA